MRQRLNLPNLTKRTTKVKRSELEIALRAGNIENARRESLIIAEHLTGKTQAYLAMGDIDLPGEASLMLKRRLTGEPLQYILGEWHFYNIKLKVTPDVLIPRPETEELVERALAFLPQGGTFADLCSGSGCIALAIAVNRPDTRGIAVELSKNALKVLSENIALCRQNEHITAFEGDVTTDVFGCGEKFDLITANPPYITPSEMLSLEKELFFEPKMALTDFVNGMTIIEKIIKIYPAHLKPNGVMLMEIGSSQGEKTEAVAKNEGLDVKILKDYSNLDRIAVIAHSQSILSQIK